jgi:hypothetical protein
MLHCQHTNRQASSEKRMNPTVLALVLCVAVLAGADRPTQAPHTVELPAGRFQLNHEKTLISDLLDNYKVKFGRPVANRSENILVRFEKFYLQF